MDDLQYDFDLFKQIVRATFNQRRKTILNTLSRANVFGVAPKNDREFNKQQAELSLNKASIKPQARPETLEVLDFIRLTQMVTKNNLKTQ